MASKKGKGGNSKYAAEIERLKELNAIKEVLKKSDIENAALTNTSKDSETVSDNVVNNMLDQLNLDKNSNKDLEIIESITSKGAGKADLIKRTHTSIKKAPNKTSVKKKAHMIKKDAPFNKKKGNGSKSKKR
jgi:hypothetical protein